jgi:hypothetical protein
VSVEDVARVCHEANRAWQQVTGDPVVSPPWDDVPQWQRDSAVAGVREALDGASPAQLHALWCEEKWNTGWTFGPEKDPERRTHPCLVPYDQLPADQLVKDHLFSAIVTALGGTIGV